MVDHYFRFQMKLFALIVAIGLLSFLEFDQATPWAIGLGENKHQKMPIAEVLNEPYLTAKYQGDTVEIDYQVQRFNLRLVPNHQGLAQDFQITYGNRLTQNQLTAISKLIDPADMC